MKVKVNNKDVETEACDMLALSCQLNLPEKGIAVAVNQQMVPREEWDECALKEGDDILIIKAVCGG